MEFDKHGHILIAPLELQPRAFEDPDGLIHHALTEWGRIDGFQFGTGPIECLNGRNFS